MAEGGTVRSASGYAVRGNPRQAPEMPPPPRRKVTPKAATIQKMPSQLRAQGQKWLGGSPRFSVTDGPYGKLTPMAEGGTVRRKVAPKAAMIQRRPSQLRSQGQKWVAPMKKGGTVRRKK